MNNSQPIRANYLEISKLIIAMFQTAATSLTATTPTPTAVSSTGSARAGLVSTSSVLLTSTGSQSRSCVTGTTGWSVAADLPVTSVRRDVPDLSHSLSLNQRFDLSLYFAIKTLCTYLHQTLTES